MLLKLKVPYLSVTDASKSAYEQNIISEILSFGTLQLAAVLKCQFFLNSFITNENHENMKHISRSIN